MIPSSRQKKLWCVGAAMILPWLASFLYFVILRDNWLARAVYGGTKLFTLVWPVVALVWIQRERMPRVDWRASRHWRALPLGLLTGLAIAGAMGALLFTPLRDVLLQGGARIREKTRDLGIFEHFWFYAILISVAHSLLEEYYWRWFVFGQLTTLVRLPTAHALAGVAFAAHHVVVVSQFFGTFWGFVLGGCVGAGGVIWSVMFHRQKSLSGAWLSHMIADLAIMSIGYWIMQA